MSNRIRVREIEPVISGRSTLITIFEGEPEHEEELLCLENIEEVDELIHKLIAVRNRAWPGTPLAVRL